MFLASLILQGVVLVYVTVIMVMVVRQFSNLSTIEEDQKIMLVVDRGGGHGCGDPKDCYGGLPVFRFVKLSENTKLSFTRD